MALGAQQQVKICKTGQLSRHYMAEISLNVTLNHNQPTNQPMWMKECTVKKLMALYLKFNYCWGYRLVRN